MVESSSIVGDPENFACRRHAEYRTVGLVRPNDALTGERAIPDRNGWERMGTDLLHAQYKGTARLAFKLVQHQKKKEDQAAGKQSEQLEANNWEVGQDHSAEDLCTSQL
jgi:hypothetical protein